MKCLFVKISSMGDLIHSLPAITDAKHMLPECEIDWVCDEGFSDIPAMHSGVSNIITMSHRRWKKSWFQACKSGELQNFYQQLTAKRYDVIIDAQGNFKSALVTRLARGTGHGGDKHSVHERFAHLAYQTRHAINKKQHAVHRTRLLMSKALGYAMPTTLANYNINLDALPEAPLSLPKQFIICHHAASRDYKLWPEPYWQALFKAMNQIGMAVVFTWGSEDEHQRSQRFAEYCDQGLVLPPLSITEKAAVIAKASAAVSSDTGLGHLTAALNIPSVSFYGPTDPALCGTVGAQQIHLKADFPCSPCWRSKCHYEGPSEYFPACLGTIAPNEMIQAVKSLLKV